MISTEIRRSQTYVGTGDVNSYTFPFRVFAADQVKVYVRAADAASGTLLDTTQYSVTLASASAQTVGGTVTLSAPLAAGAAGGGAHHRGGVPLRLRAEPLAPLGSLGLLPPAGEPAGADLPALLPDVVPAGHPRHRPLRRCPAAPGGELTAPGILFPCRMASNGV